MNEDLNNYYFKNEEPNQSCLLALRSIILLLDKGITESLKWYLPCFSYKNRMLCFLNIEKKSNEPYILFVKGNQMNNHALEQGDRKQMRIFRVKAHQDLPVDLLEQLLTEALELYP